MEKVSVERVSVELLGRQYELERQEDGTWRLVLPLGAFSGIDIYFSKVPTAEELAITMFLLDTEPVRDDTTVYPEWEYEEDLAHFYSVCDFARKELRKIIFEKIGVLRSKEWSCTI